jgi:hypothetical protein
MRIVAPADAPMTWALVASAMVHAGFAVMLVTGGVEATTSTPRLDVALRPAIAAPLPPLDASTPLQPAAFVLPAFRPLGALAALPPDLALPAPEDARTPAADGPIGDVTVRAEVLLDGNRLGPMLSRQMTEFPIEVDSPVMLDEPIVAHLPASLAATSSGEPIVVWAVVGWNGLVDEIQLTSGDPDLAEPVLEAVRQAHFTPARNALVAYRYPIALEFRWPRGEPATAAADTPRVDALAAGRSTPAHPVTTVAR